MCIRDRFYKCLGKSQNSLISFGRFKFCKSSFVVLSFALYNLALLMFDKLSEDQREELNIVREENNLFITGHSDWLGRTIALTSIKYSSSRGGWPWANDVSVPREVTPGLPGWNFFVQCPGFIFLAAR